MIATSQLRPNPYVGPRAFRYGETLYGRDREVIELLGLLIAERILLFYSPSGAGKTSLVQAALIPALEKEDFQVQPVIRVSLEPSPGLERLPTTNRYVSERAPLAGRSAAGGAADVPGATRQNDTGGLPGSAGGGARCTRNPRY